MKRKEYIASGMLVIFLLSQFQLGVVFANSQNKLETTKAQSIEALEQVEQVIDISFEKIEKKIEDTEVSARLKKKEQEIKAHIQATQEKIEKSHTQSNIKKEIKAAQKVIVLKVVSGVTPQKNIEESISSEVADTPEELEQAKETIKDSLETKSGDYALIIKTKKNYSQALKLFRKFDASARIDFLYANENVNYFEVFVKEDSLFKQEMLDDIEEGNIPESFLGVEIVQPEVFGINSIDFRGEDLASTWGVNSYTPSLYLDSLASQEKKIKVGIIDTGIDASHPDLQGKVSGGYDFVNDDNDASDDQGHGTHVSGTIAASLNGQGIIGVNPYVELVPLKICNQRGFCPTYAVTKALSYAKDHNIDILNMSLGGRSDPNNNPICDGVSSFVAAGGIIIAAAGNSDVDTSTFVPGGCSESITVAAIDRNNQRASFSNYGNKVDVAAPGVDVYSTYPTNKGSYKKLSGTSMATPHIVGLVSVMKSFDPSLTTNGIKSTFKQFPMVVTTEGSKPIASGVNVPELLASLQRDSALPLRGEGELGEEVVEETKEKTIEETPPPTGTPIEKGREEQEDELNSNLTSDKGGHEGGFDNVEIVADLVWNPNQNTDKSDGNENEETHTPKTGLVGPIQIDFGNKDLGVNINSVGEDEFEVIGIPEVTEENIVIPNGENLDIAEVQYFDENGKALDEGEVKINSISEEEKVEGEYVEGEFNVEDIQANNETFPSSETPLENGREAEDVDEEDQVTEIFLGGVTKGVEINSVGEEEDFDEVEVSEYVKDDREKLNTSITSMTGETIEHPEQTKTIFLDSDQENIQINTIQEEEQKEIENFTEETGTGAIIEEEENTGFGILSALNTRNDGLIAEYIFNNSANDTGPNHLHGNANYILWQNDGTKASAYLGNNSSSKITLGNDIRYY